MTSIKLKKSSVAGKVPVDSDLAHGELAINFQDGKLFYKDASNNIKAFIDSAAVGSLITAGQGLDSAGVKTVTGTGKLTGVSGNFVVSGDLTATNEVNITNSNGQNNVIFTNSAGELCFGADGSTSNITFRLDDEDGQPIFRFTEEGGTSIFDGGDTDVTTHKDFIFDSAGVIQFDLSDRSLKFGDNVKAKFGDGDDLEISHNGTHSIIKETGSGQLRFQTDIFHVLNANNTETLIKAQQNLGVELYYNDLKRLETGIDNVQILNVDGGASKLKVSSNNNTIGTNAAAVELYANFFRKAGLSIFGDSIGASSPIEEWFIGRPYGQSAQPLHITSNTSGQKAAVFNQLGSVELYYNNVKKLETSATGAKISGGTGDAVLLLEADTTNTDENDNARIEYSQDGGGVTASHGTDGNNRFFIQTTTGGGTTKFDMHGGAETRLYYASNIKLETLDSGVNITGNLRVNNAPFSSGIDSNAVTSLIDSAYVLSRGGASIEVLQEDSSLSHLQRLSFSPVITDGEVLLQPKISVLDSAGTESLLNINFAGGGGVDSAATIAIVNGVLTNADSATFNQISIPDGAALGATNRINVGSSDDLKIYHDGLNSHIAEGGTGDLNISGTNNIILKSSPTGEFYAVFRNNGAAELYHNNNKRIETTDSGATITGSITADSAVLPTIFLDSDGYADRPRISRTGGSSFSKNTVQINTATGYLQLGPANGLFSHFLTNLPRFYFNKRINVDEGIITSYDEDLQLQRVNVTRVTLTDSGATVDGRLRADSATISGLKLPTADGTVNQAILTDGAGNLTFGTVALSAAGGATGVFNKVAVNSFTGNNSNKNFTLAAAPVGGKNSVVITINGVVQHVNTYSLSGSTITLDSAPQTGDAIEMRTHDDYSANVQIRDYASFVYTPSTNTTAFSGADANGNTLAYDQGKVQVYLNGAKLVTGSDYTETSGTTLTLDSAIGSGDTLEIISLSKAAIADFGVLPVDSDLTTTTANQIIHEFNRSDFRTVKYLVQLEHDSDNKYHSEEILLTHNNTTVAMTTYAQILLDSNLGSFDADISGANVRLKLTPTKTNTSVKLRAIRVGA